MSKIIVPPAVVAPSYNLTVTILFNTISGDTELQVRSNVIADIKTIQLAGILSEHLTGVLRQMATGQLKVVPIHDK